MAKSNAERQREYRQRKREEKARLEQAAGVPLPSQDAPRRRAARSRERAEAKVLQAAARSDSQVDVKEAAAALVASEEEPPKEYDHQALEDALEVGRCCRIWEEISGGYLAPQEELASWLASEPPQAWLFYAWVYRSPWARDFRDWRAEWLPQAAS